MLRFDVVITGPVCLPKNVGLFEDACHAVNKGASETELPFHAPIVNSLPGQTAHIVMPALCWLHCASTAAVYKNSV